MARLTPLERVASGELSARDLEILRENAIRKGGNDDLVAACDSALIKLIRAGKAKASADDTIVERRGRYLIMLSATGDDGTLRDPAMADLAEAVSQRPAVEDVAILKTQIRFYYKGRHMVCGRASKGGYWLGVLDESKIADATVKAWERMGVLARGTYFSTNYVNVAFPHLSDAAVILEQTQFVS